MRAIGRNEMQLDPAPRSSKPFLHQSGVVIARVVKKDMDEHQQRIERLDRFQEPDRRHGVDGYDLDHPGLSGREVDRAVNIDPIAPARLFLAYPVFTHTPKMYGASRHRSKALR